MNTDLSTQIYIHKFINGALLQSELKMETVTLDVLALVLVEKSHNIFSRR